MRIIEYLIDKIDCELEDARKYIEKAQLYKEDYPEVSNLLYDLSKEELNHMERLHVCVVSLINTYKRNGNEIPKEMKVLYDYLHEKYIDDANDIRTIITKVK